MTVDGRNRGGRPRSTQPKRTRTLVTLLTEREDEAVNLLCQRLKLGRGELVRGLIYHAADLLVGGEGDPTLGTDAAALESLLAADEGGDE